MDFIKNAVSGSGDKKAEGSSKPAGDGQDYGDKGTLHCATTPSRHTVEAAADFFPSFRLRLQEGWSRLRPQDRREDHRRCTRSVRESYWVSLDPLVALSESLHCIVAELTKSLTEARSTPSTPTKL